MAARLLQRVPSAVHRLAGWTRVSFTHRLLTHRLLTHRLLMVGGFLVCGWLLSGVQSAHAADRTPAPLPTTVVANATSHINRDLASRDAGGRGQPTQEKGRVDADDVGAGGLIGGIGDALDKADVLDKADAIADKRKRAVTDRRERPASQASGQGSSHPTVRDAVRDATDGVTGAVERASRAGSTVAGPDPRSAAAGQPSGTPSVPTTLPPVPGSSPIPPVTSIPALLEPLAAPLSAVSGPLAGMAGQIDGGVGLLEGPVGTVITRASGVIASVVATSTGLVRGTGVVVSDVLDQPVPTTGFRYPLGVASWPVPINPSNICSITDPPFLSEAAPAPPVGARQFDPAAGIRSDAAMSWMMWLPPVQTSEIPSEDPWSGPISTPSSPVLPSAPRSGEPSHTLSGPSHGDGAGDAARPWEARLVDLFMPAWSTTPPVVRTAADEPGFSPD